MKTSYAGKNATTVILGLFFVLLLTVFGLDVHATESGLYCSETTNNAFKACRFEAREDLNIDSTKCINVADDGLREELVDFYFLD